MVDKVDKSLFAESFLSVENFGVGGEFDGNFLFFVNDLKLNCCHEILNVFGGLDDGFVFEFGDVEVEPGLGFLGGELKSVLELKIIPDFLSGGRLIFGKEGNEEIFGAVNNMKLFLIERWFMILWLLNKINIVVDEFLDCFKEYIVVFSYYFVKKLVECF